MGQRPAPRCFPRDGRGSAWYEVAVRCRDDLGRLEGQCNRGGLPARLVLTIPSAITYSTFPAEHPCSG